MTSSLIKACDLEGGDMVQTLNFASGLPDVQQRPPDQALSVEARTIRALRDEVDALNRKLEVLEEDQTKNLKKMQEETREACAAEFQSDEAARIELILSGLSAAQESFQAELSHLEELSLAISETALDGVFGQDHRYRPHLLRMIDAQLRGLHEETVLGLVVSQEDFSLEETQAELLTLVEGRNINIDYSAELSSGDVRLRLRLGQIELSVKEHWAKLKILMASLAE